MRAAFTLAELLIVIAIIGILAGMSLPIINLARAQSKGTDTSALLTKISAALFQFKRDAGAYPYYKYTSDDMPEAPTTANGFDKLALRLCSELKQEDYDKLRTDIDAAHAAYSTGPHRIDYTILPDNNLNDLPEPWKSFSRDPAAQGDSFKDNRPIYAALLNRMATERAVVAILSGQVQVKGIFVPGVSYDKTNDAVLSAPQSEGWRDDYLSDSVDRRRYISNRGKGERFVDGWGNPLIYISPVTAGVMGGYPNTGMWVSDKPIPIPIDVDMMYRKASASDQARNCFWPLGRRATTAADSDYRTEAPPGQEFHFELMSAGQDRRAAPARNASENMDNIFAGGKTRIKEE